MLPLVLVTLLLGGYFITEGTRVRYVSAAGVITTVAGSGLTYFGAAQAVNGNGGPATLARFVSPSAVYPDPVNAGRFSFQVKWVGLL